jgi:hypothetical protein
VRPRISGPAVGLDLDEARSGIGAHQELAEEIGRDLEWVPVEESAAKALPPHGLALRIDLLARPSRITDRRGLRDASIYVEMRDRVSDRSFSDRTLGQQFLRLVVLVLAALLVAWLAVRVLVGIVHFLVWLITTAVILALVIAALYFVLGGGRRRD